MKHNYRFIRPLFNGFGRKKSIAFPGFFNCSFQPNGSKLSNLQRWNSHRKKSHRIHPDIPTAEGSMTNPTGWFLRRRWPVTRWPWPVGWAIRGDAFPGREDVGDGDVTWWKRPGWVVARVPSGLAAQVRWPPGKHSFFFDQKKGKNTYEKSIQSQGKPIAAAPFGEGLVCFFLCLSILIDQEWLRIELYFIQFVGSSLEVADFGG